MKALRVKIGIKDIKTIKDEIKEKVDLNDPCMVCYQRVANAKMSPCKHDICTQCYLEMGKRAMDLCPLCRTKIGHITIIEASTEVE